MKLSCTEMRRMYVEGVDVWRGTGVRFIDVKLAIPILYLSLIFRKEDYLGTLQYIVIKYI